jgi:putative chitinase
VTHSPAIAEPSITIAPSPVALPRLATLSACWFWQSHGLNPIADAGDPAGFNQISFKINGGWNGKENRLEKWAEARTVMLA